MMVTEFAPCGSLMDSIKNRPEPSEQIKVKIVLDAAKGLEYLDVNGIIHLDVNPAKVPALLSSSAVPVSAKL